MLNSPKGREEACAVGERVGLTRGVEVRTGGGTLEATFPECVDFGAMSFLTRSVARGALAANSLALDPTPAYSLFPPFW